MDNRLIDRGGVEMRGGLGINPLLSHPVCQPRNSFKDGTLALKCSTHSRFSRDLGDHIFWSCKASSKVVRSHSPHHYPKLKTREHVLCCRKTSQRLKKAFPAMLSPHRNVIRLVLMRPSLGKRQTLAPKANAVYSSTEPLLAEKYLHL